ncbi:PrcB C-terminal [Marininema halotolerans]|uniref:PrcB C-terminal n=1 Tax=Marininema halotolerans TaxID=1155944 RepID=A0A1I6QQ34_9BACL|nr:PrcB C-terminal [Marininema halotolerans]
MTDHEGIHFLLIATGLKPNPGHRLVVEQMKENTLYIREVPPAEGSMAPQVVTYPYLLLKGKGNPPQVLDSITGKQLIIADP